MNCIGGRQSHKGVGLSRNHKFLFDLSPINTTFLWSRITQNRQKNGSDLNEMFEDIPALYYINLENNPKQIRALIDRV